MIVEKSVLKDAMLELKTRDKISQTTYNDMLLFIDSLTKTNMQEVKYINFNKVSSENITFTDSTRTATWSTGTAELITNKIDLANITLKSLKLKGTDKNISWEISFNGSDYYGINSYDLNEVITDGFYLKCIITQANSITGIEVIYENN
jgi:hypothetical protein